MYPVSPFPVVRHSLGMYRNSLECSPACTESPSVVESTYTCFSRAAAIVAFAM